MELGTPSNIQAIYLMMNQQVHLGSDYVNIELDQLALKTLSEKSTSSSRKRSSWNNICHSNVRYQINVGKYKSKKNCDDNFLYRLQPLVLLDLTVLYSKYAHPSIIFIYLFSNYSIRNLHSEEIIFRLTMFRPRRIDQ